MRPSIWLDVSFNVYRSGLALVQALAYTIPASTLDGEARPRRLAVQRAWVQQEEGRGVTRAGENTERREMLVYALTLEDVGALFEAVSTGRPLTLAVTPWDERRETILKGVAALSDKNRADTTACLEALVN